MAVGDSVSPRNLAARVPTPSPTAKLRSMMQYQHSDWLTLTGISEFQGSNSDVSYGPTIALRTDCTASRRFAKRMKDEAAQALWLSAIATALDGASREEAATMAAWTVRRFGTW
jgi:hypothetical protein